MSVIKSTERVKICKDREISVYEDEEHLYEDDKSDGIIPGGLFCNVCGQEICEDCKTYINHRYLCKRCAALNEKYNIEIEKCEKKKRELSNEIYQLNNQWKKESLKSREVE